MGGAAERGRREKAVEERRHAAVMRRLHRAAHASHTALASLNTLQVGSCFHAMQQSDNTRCIHTFYKLFHGFKLTSVSTMVQSEREEQLGAISCVVWLRQSQTAGDITPLTRLPIPNIDVRIVMLVNQVITLTLLHYGINTKLVNVCNTGNSRFT